MDVKADIQFLCCNTNYPNRRIIYKNDISLLECTEPNDDVYLTYCECAKSWAKYNHSWNEDLLEKSCGENIPDYVSPITNFSKVPNPRYPEMKWRFIWGHYYIIERKLNNGSWEIIYTYTLPGNTVDPPDTDFVDTSINLWRFQGYVRYRVYNKIYDELSEPSIVLLWDTAPQINGPINDTP